jgi:1-acyl-sn-glycerol-3-phosphate acyltransferase
VATIETAAVLAVLALAGGHAIWTWFAWLEPRVLAGFARVWHSCRRLGPARVPATGPVIVVANHPSLADPGFLIATSGRPVHFLHARESYDVFFLTWLFRRAGSIPVGRDGQDVRAVRVALRRLREGAALGIFPEGELTRVARARGLPLRSGAALLALRSRAPVIPASITGSRENASAAGAWLLPSAVRVRYGAPVDLSAYYGRPITRQLLHEVTELFMRHVAALCAAPASRPEPEPAWVSAAPPLPEFASPAPGAAAASPPGQSALGPGS